MFYYKYKDKLIISKKKYEEYASNIPEEHNIKSEINTNLLTSSSFEDFHEISQDEGEEYDGTIYALNLLNPKYSRRSFVVSHKEHLFIEEETLDLLKKPQKIEEEKSLNGANPAIPQWVADAIEEKRIISLNIGYENWKDVIEYKEPEKWKINVVGLGDVGGTLLTGLKLLGCEKVSQLGLYDRDENKTNRWKLELGQILSPNMVERDINIVRLKEGDIFNCDLFVFCVSVGVPEVGKEVQDVRLIQFKGNSKIISSYAKMARECGFKGIFAVISDPVDLLCKVAFEESNKDQSGIVDFKGLAPEQIRGYGLGVMNARACYYAMENKQTENYPLEGRAFGPHGEGLIIANSIENYREDLSKELTQKTKTANLEVRGTGFKPYIAPALSSGSLALLSTINSQWHYSANFIGGTFMGCKNRFLKGCTEVETLEFPLQLFEELQHTYKLLDELYNS